MKIYGRQQELDISNVCRESYGEAKTDSLASLKTVRSYRPLIQRIALSQQ